MENFDQKPEFNSPKEKENENLPEVSKIMHSAINEAEKIMILTEHRNSEGKLLSENGQISNLQNELHWKMVRTPSFKKWFGDWQKDQKHSSKIIDSNGEPLIVYHSTNEKIEGLELDPDKGSFKRIVTHGIGVYFSPYLGLSRNYGSGTFFCFLKINKLVKISDSLMLKNGYFTLQDPNIDTLIKQTTVRTILSIIRPCNIGMVNKIKKSKYNGAEKYSEIIEFNKEDIMIIPSPVINIGDLTAFSPDNEETKPGHYRE